MYICMMLRSDRYLMVEYSMYQITLFQRKKITTWHTPRLTEDEWNDIYGGQ